MTIEERGVPAAERETPFERAVRWVKAVNFRSTSHGRRQMVSGEPMLLAAPTLADLLRLVDALRPVVPVVPRELMAAVVASSAPALLVSLEIVQRGLAAASDALAAIVFADQPDDGGSPPWFDAQTE